ncbi:uncharacterized protein LOC135194194 [Vanessa tameamea]|uniref:Uncharacterized protein LOC135194194 n=1 Tax=Vanessa tameamea TaxID=334116 RepID=A0ABM4AVR7_VANTA
MFKFPDQKKIQKLEFETGDLYDMNKLLQSALDYEMAELCNVFVSACDESKGKNEETMHEKLTKRVVKDFKKVVKVHATRRVLNITSNLILRLFVTPKSTKRAVLEDFLKSHGAVTLKKSEKNKMYLATCGSYESYDKLVALGSTKIGNAVLTLKPLHLVGPPIKKNIRSQQFAVSNVIGNNESKSSIPEVTASDDDLADSCNESIINKDKHNVSLGDQDVVIVEAKNDVVVIEDNDRNHKSNDKSAVHAEIADLKPNSNSDNDPNNKDVIIDDETKHKTIHSESADVESKTNDNAPNNETPLDNECQSTCNVEGNEKQDIIVTPSDENKLAEDILESVDVAEDDLEDF